MKLNSEVTQKVILWLNQGNTINYKQLADHFAFTEKSAQRLIKQLRGQGVEIEEKYIDRIKHFYIPESKIKLETNVTLNNDQLLALAISVIISQSYFGTSNLQKALQSGFRNMLDSLEIETNFEPEILIKNIYSSFPEQTNIDPELIKQIIIAIAECRTAEFVYYSSREQQNRTEKAYPLGLTDRRGSWIMIAKDKRTKKIKEYALPSIKNFSKHDIFVRPDNFNLHEYEKNKFSLGGDNTHTVKILANAECAVAFERKKYFKSQKEEPKNPDGSMVVTYEVEGLFGITAHILSFGYKVKVLEPPELIEIIKEQAKKIIANY